jgi:hypothetical protein
MTIRKSMLVTAMLSAASACTQEQGYVIAIAALDQLSGRPW